MADAEGPWRTWRDGTRERLRQSTLVVLAYVLLLPGLAHVEGADGDARSIPVRVVYPDGAPASGAEVGVRWRGPESLHTEGHKTDASGRGSVKVPYPGRYLLSVFSAPGIDSAWLHRYVYTGATHVDVGYEGPVPEIKFTVPRAGSLRVDLDRGTLPPPGEYGVYEVLLKRYYSDRVLSGPYSVPRPKHERVEGQDNTYRFAFEGLPAGRYRVEAFSRDRTRAVREVIVSEGAQAAVALAMGPEADPVELVWNGPLGPAGRQLFGVNGYARPGGATGTFDTTSSSHITRALAAGRYLVILWDLRLAMLIEVREGGGQKIAIEPPPELLAPQGTRKLQVDVTVDEFPCPELPVLVAPVREGPLDAGRWFRMQNTQSAGPHVFEGLQPGLYDVFLLDGGLGLRLGLPSNPLVRRIELKDRDESVRFDLPGPASRGAVVPPTIVGPSRDQK